MATTICYEVFPGQRSLRRARRILVENHNFIEKENQYGSYFYKEVDPRDSWQTKLVLNIHKYKFRSFDKRYNRGTSYRKTFFEHNKGPYRCVYCGRRLRKDDLEVDHLIPVAKVKETVFARTLLHLSGIPNVNDAKNLVSSCSTCNRRKSDKMGFWVLRGVLGKNRIFWIIRDIFAAILVILSVILLMYALSKFGINMEFISNLFK